jgi:hypothetical protein
MTKEEILFELDEIKAELDISREHLRECEEAVWEAQQEQDLAEDELVGLEDLHASLCEKLAGITGPNPGVPKDAAFVGSLFDVGDT